MFQLDREQFKKVYPILSAEYFDHTFSYSVLEGKIEGDIFTDDSMNPKTVLIRIFNGLYHLFGEVNSDPQLYEWFEKDKKDSKTPIVLFVSKEWEDTVSTWNLHKANYYRKSFQFNEAKYHQHKQLSLGDGLKILPITEELIQKSKQFPQKFYNLYWMNTANFLKHGVGYCIVNDYGDIVTEATSPAVSRHKVDIDIFTADNYRGQGLAKVAASHMIEYALKKDSTVDWTCDYDNLASIKLAKSLGFEEGEGHPIYIIK